MYNKIVQRLKAFRYRLVPGTQDLDRIRRWGGCARYVYNRLLAEREAAFKTLGPDPSTKQKKDFNKAWSYKAMSARVTRWRGEVEWLAEVPYHGLQNAAVDLQTAYKNWWAGRGGRPNFKKKIHGSDSWRETDPVNLGINGQAVKLPKLGWVRARISRPFVGEVRQATVKQEGDQWFVSLLAAQEIAEPKPNGGPPIGLDMGIVHAMSDSNGLHHELPMETTGEKRRLRRLARAVSRKKKGSNNRGKAQKRLNRARRRIRRRVHDRIHKLTTALAKNHGLVAVEDLDTRNMTASAAGTLEEPGRNVAQKRGLNRELLARCSGETRRQLAYKCPWYGSLLVKVPPMNSSRECSVCGFISGENRVTQALFRCVRCGHEENADTNAAKVIRKRGIILAAGHAATACGEDVRRRLGHATSVKQEPIHRPRRCAV
jgi:putative transposase